MQLKFHLLYVAFVVKTFSVGSLIHQEIESKWPLLITIILLFFIILPLVLLSMLGCADTNQLGLINKKGGICNTSTN